MKPTTIRYAPKKYTLASRIPILGNNSAHTAIATKRISAAIVLCFG